MRRLIIIILFLPLVALAQPVTEIPLEYTIEAADTAYYYNDYYNAAEWYEKAYNETRTDDPERALKFTYIIADCYDKIRDYTRAERWYQRAIDRDTLFDANAFFNLARLKKMNGKYEEAQTAFQEIIDNPETSDLAALAQSQIQGIQLAYGSSRAADIQVLPMGRKINSRNQESSPALGPEGELFYVSFNNNELITLGEKNDDYHARIFSASANEGGEYGKPSELDELQRPGFHNSSVAISENGEVLYFTRARVEGNQVTSSQLYMSTRKGKKWGAPQVIKELNGDFRNMHPFETYLFNQKVLLFASDRSSGYGNLDLYYARINDDGTFGSPINLGESINTPADDITPYFDETGLYFSSDGHPGLGGLDIFKCTFDGTDFSNPINMGKGINTSLDEMYYTPSGKNTGFLVSNREGNRSLKSKTCCDDLFKFDRKEILLHLYPFIFDAKDSTALNGATVKVFQKVGEELDVPDVQSKPDTNAFDFPLDIDRAYLVVVSRDGYYPDTTEFNTVGVRANKNYRGTFYLKSKPPEEREDLVKETFKKNRVIRLNNIYYDFNDDKVLQDAKKDLNFIFNLMQEYPTTKIELSSHTDARGDNPFNQDLSQRRANSARQYLLGLGIAADRIRAVGYGETQIINRCVDGVRCSDIEHRLNRRTEFKITEGPDSIRIERSSIIQNPINNGLGAVKMPIMKFELDTVSLGSVKAGDKQTGTINFENVGDADLVITIMNACECTTLDWPRSPIAPGEKASISVEYDSEDKEGFQEVTVDIYANTEPELTNTYFTIMVETN